MKVLEAPASQPTQPTALPLDHEWSGDGAIDVFGGIVFLWRYRYVIVSVTLIALGLGLLAALATPRQFTAIATAFVNIPRAQNPLAPEGLSVEALDRLANSELVSAQVGAELRRQDLMAGGTVFDYRTVLYRSTVPQKPYLPLLGLSAVASSPELSRAAANAWVSVLIAETQKLSAATRASAVDFIVTEYPKAAERLNEQERTLELLQREQDAALQAARTAAAVSLKEEQLWSLEQTIVELQSERTRLAVDMKAIEATVMALEQELKQVPPVIVVSKAITDEALWDRTVSNTGRMPPDLPDARLRSQEINPVHSELTRKRAEARVRRSELAAKGPALDEQIEQVRREATSIRASLGTGALSVANLERRHNTEVAAQQREIEGTRATFQKLQEQIGDAQIVKANPDRSLTLGSLAELPGGPSGPNVSRAVGLAGLAGLALAIVAAWVVDRVRKRQAAVGQA
jgi:uncharacterized protein involved in exopolysaccharide biosynthesis